MSVTLLITNAFVNFLAVQLLITNAFVNFLAVHDTKHLKFRVPKI